MKEFLVSWLEFFEVAKASERGCLFRGQPSASYGLIPSVGRPHKHYTPTLEVEKFLFNQFKLKAKPRLAPVENDLDILVLARHYGLRTRLLDWSSNPLVALYFAFHGFDSSNCFPPSIYIHRNPKIRFHYDICRNPWRIEEDLFFEPPSLDERIFNQHAYLSIHPNPFRPFEDESIERYNIIPTIDAINEVQDFLYRLGTRHSTVYPGIEGLCKDINDNPSPNDKGLKIEMNVDDFWKPTPFSWSCRSWDETRSMLIDERRLSAFLDFKSDSSIVGMQIESEGLCIGRLFGYSPDSGVLLYDEGNHSIEQKPIADGTMDSLRLTEDTIKKYFPVKDVTFRTKRPKTSPGNIGFHHPLYGSQYWSGESQQTTT